jgi:molecular chaperone HscB
MSIDQSHFALFGLAPGFALDAAALDRAYHEVQGQVHPDRHTGGDASAQRVALQWATRANEAYQVLRDPIARARYLCELRGIDLGVETNTRMSPQFLVEQMEWREALEEARETRDLAALGALEQRLAERRARELDHVAQLFARNGDDTELAGAVREMMFIEKFGDDIAATLDALDSGD